MHNSWYQCHMAACAQGNTPKDIYITFSLAKEYIDIYIYVFFGQSMYSFAKLNVTQQRPVKTICKLPPARPIQSLPKQCLTSCVSPPISKTSMHAHIYYTLAYPHMQTFSQRHLLKLLLRFFFSWLTHKSCIWTLLAYHNFPQLWPLHHKLSACCSIKQCGRWWCQTQSTIQHLKLA